MEGVVKKRAYLAMAGVVACLLLQLPSASQSSVSLTGTVSSDAEGPMEGVVVSAKKVGGKVTVSVVSDHEGRYVFPGNRLPAGEHEIRIRATGYDAANAHMVASVKPGKETKTDIKLNKT